ncbi:MAG: hypothetical protein IID34_10815, partial [Planctomycetes bacterium]|nr:hypothetical protein [Planctomycetota bacterium]
MRLTRRMGPDYRACARGRLLRLFVWSSCLVAVLTLRPFAAAQDARPGFGGDHPRITTSAPIFFDAVETVRFTPSGSVSDLGLRTASAGSCVLQSTYTDADFSPPGNFSIVLGVAETEIFAASYTIAPEFFPIEIRTVEMVFAQTGVEDTVTELELWIMKGTPDQSQIVHIEQNIFLDFTTTLADAINVMIDLSANPVLVENNDTDTFSVGFRIVEHNNQTENPCNFNPPANSNAFPTVDVSGVQNEADNWLFSLNCGPLGCPAFWNSFEFQGLCQPAGDWVLRATWTPQTCDFLRGACCLGDGNCTVNEFDFICTGQGGRFLGDQVECPKFCDGACCFSDGACSVLTSDDCEELDGTYVADGTPCEPDDPCPDPIGACCVVIDDIFCFEITEIQCGGAGGTWNGAATECIDADQNGIDDICETPVGACCLPSGTCDNEVTEEDCLSQIGGYAGDDSLCANVTCVGACCLGTSCLGDTEATGCPFDWYGPQTSCDDDPNPCLVDPANGACCPADGLPCQEVQETSCSSPGDTWFGPGSTCTEGQCDLPPDPVGACCVVDGEPCECQEGLTSLECEDLQGEWGGSNSLCDDCEPCEACCDPCIQTCTNELPSVCVTAGDQPQGPGTTCANTACDAPAGACCFSEPDGCENRTESQCNLLGGIWQGCEVFCADAGVDCTVTGACCLPNETCEELQFDACEINQGGDYQGDGNPCVPGLCEQIECTFDSECDDSNGCNGVETCVANVCQNGPPPAEGTLCNDGNVCTENDQCTAGNCVGTAVDCSGSDDQCNTASCDPGGAEGNCNILTPKPNGTPCNDSDVCTENDQCTAGSCGGTGVNCSGAGDQCNIASCDSSGAEGNCDILTPVKDGTACNDGAPCTEND